MTELTADLASAPAKGSKLKKLVPVVLAIVAAAAGYIAADRLLSGKTAPAESPPHGADHADSALPFSFVPLDPMTVSLGDSRLLRFGAQVEVLPGSEEYVAALMPRMIDVLQDYLRAVGPEDLSRTGVLYKLRSQMLRRLQMVAGPEHVRDLLIMEFVLN